MQMKALLLILGWFNLISRSAINVIDDDGTAYTFVYDNRSHSDLGFWKLESEDQWHQWEFGLQQQSHMEQLARVLCVEDSWKIVSACETGRALL